MFAISRHALPWALNSPENNFQVKMRPKFFQRSHDVFFWFLPFRQAVFCLWWPSKSCSLGTVLQNLQILLCEQENFARILVLMCYFNDNIAWEPRFKVGAYKAFPIPRNIGPFFWEWNRSPAKSTGFRIQLLSTENRRQQKNTPFMQVFQNTPLNSTVVDCTVLFL